MKTFVHLHRDSRHGAETGVTPGEGLVQVGGEPLKLVGYLALLVAGFYLIRHIVRRRVERKQWDGVPVPRAWFPDEESEGLMAEESTELVLESDLVRDVVTHDEAEQLALCLIDRAFNNAEKPQRRFRASIPANPREDTDLRLMAYIKQRRREASHRPGLSAAYAETRDALVDATRALRVIDDSRGDAVTERQHAAVAELRRLINVCEAALGHGPFSPGKGLSHG